jgi:type I restriction enzyme S subunit
MPPRVFQVKSGWLADQACRLDATAYGEGGLAARDRIKAGPWPWWPLADLATLYLPPRFNRRYVRDPSRGIRFLSSSDMLLADLNGLPMLSKRATPNLDALTGVAGSTLVSRSGTIGRTAYWREELQGMAVSEHVIHVRPLRSHVLCGYLFSFLTSAPAQAMIRQHTFGSVVQHIEPGHLAGLPVPLPEVPDQRRIHNLVQLRVSCWHISWP